MVGPSFCPCGSSVSASAPRAHLTVRASAAVTASASAAAAAKMLNFRIDPSGKHGTDASCVKLMAGPTGCHEAFPVKYCGASAQPGSAQLVQRSLGLSA